MVTGLARFFAVMILLMAVDFFAELVVFEWLESNGTMKNDWSLCCGGECDARHTA